MRKLAFLVLLLFVASCSSVYLRSRDKIPLYISKHPQHQEYFTTQISRDFYLWGRYPTVHQINLDLELAKLGLIEASGLEIKWYDSWSDWGWKILTFGMYTPKTLQISAYGIKQKTHYGNF